MSFRTAIARLSAAAIVTGAASLSAGAQANSNTLYKRIGGSDSIAAVTVEYVGATLRCDAGQVQRPR